MRYSPQLDGLRCVAILLVFFGHTVLDIGKTVPLIGIAGVDLFFVLSGFLITSILFNSEGHFSAAYKRFLGRRTLRIFPIYYLCLAILFFTESDHLQGRFSYLLTYSYNYYPNLRGDHISPTWSLCVEEQFYLLWPLLVLSLRNNIRLLETIVISITLIFIGQTVFHLFPLTQMHTDIGTFPRGLGLLLGSLGAILLKSGRLPEVFRNPGVDLLGFAILIAALFADHPLTRLATPLAGLLIVLNLATSFQPSLISKVLSFRVVVFLGKISYGFYLYHGPIRYWVTEQKVVSCIWDRLPFNYMGYLGKLKYNPWLKPWLVVPFTFLLTLIAAYISFRLIEKPILSLKDKWFGYSKATKKPRQSVVAVAIPSNMSKS